MAGSYRTGIAVCDRCPRQAECVDWSLRQEDDLDGIWGGLRPGDRERERQRRRDGWQPVCDLCGESFPHLLGLRRHLRDGVHRWLSHPTDTMSPPQERESA